MFWLRIVAIGVWLGIGFLPALTLAQSSRQVMACPPAAAGSASCFARLAVSGRVTPRGYGPAELHAAYGVSASGSAPTVAVVGAYNDATIKDDLDHYDAAFGLSIFASCTSRAQSACFERVDQRGGRRFGSADAGWAAETALDVETIHQLCQRCRLELVEADSAATSDLLAAIDRAVALGARVVSMSWGEPEQASETALDAHFTASGVSFVASSGDAGYGVSYPAASARVLAVGGTRLVATTGGRLRETAWSGAGSGCSAYEPKPAWQHDTACGRRMVADVAADADPATGAAIYSSSSPGGAGWMEVGGTSLAAPIVAGMVALAGGSSGAHLYASLGTARINDITSGRNGTCGRLYLCTALPGYDGPTGIGSPSGLAAFR